MKPFTAALVVPLVLAASVVAAAAPSPAAAPVRDGALPAAEGFAYQVNAFGTRVTVDRAITSGPSAQVLVSCTSTADLHLKNAIDGIDLAPLVTTGPVSSLGDTFASPTQSVGTNDVAGLDMLKGLITADVLHSVSTTTQTDSGFQSTAKGSFFKGLTVAGKQIPDQVEPNTLIKLDGFGRVILNEQVAHVGKTWASFTINAIHLVVDQENPLGIAVNTSVVVADATSALAGPVVGTVGGAAFGSRVLIGGTLVSGPSYVVGLPCFGTDGTTLQGGGPGIAIPGVLDTGEIRTSAQGTLDQAQASGETAAAVDFADVTKGIVIATGIYADATATIDASGTVLSDGKSGFASLSVAGHPEIDASVPANTRVVIPDLGMLWLHRVVLTKTGVDVRMIELIVTKPNDRGLPIGSDIRVAAAHATVR